MDAISDTKIRRIYLSRSRCVKRKERDPVFTLIPGRAGLDKEFGCGLVHGSVRCSHQRSVSSIPGKTYSEAGNRYRTASNTPPRSERKQEKANEQNQNT